jgi:hypothetical protein
MNIPIHAVNTDIANSNVHKLMLLLEAVDPLFNDLGKILADSKKLNSRYKHHLNHLNLYFKLDNSKPHHTMNEAELEEKVKHIGFILEGISKIMIEISKDLEESKIYLQNGIMAQLQEIAQKLVALTR